MRLVTIKNDKGQLADITKLKRLDGKGFQQNRIALKRNFWSLGMDDEEATIIVINKK